MSEEIIRQEEENFEGKVSMINRMATFIKATTEELEEALSDGIMTRNEYDLARQTADKVTKTWNSSKEQIEKEFKEKLGKGESVAVVVSKGAFEDYKIEKSNKNNFNSFIKQKRNITRANKRIISL